MMKLPHEDNLHTHTHTFRYYNLMLLHSA